MSFKYAILQALHKTTEEKLKQIEENKKLDSDSVRIEIDKDGFVTINTRPMRGNGVYWGKVRDEEGKLTDFYTFLQGQPLRLKENNKPVWLVVEGMPVALNPHSLVLLGAKGPVAVHWATLSRQLNTLLEEKSQANMVQAQIEALGLKGLKKHTQLPDWLVWVPVILLIVVIAIALVKPELITGFFGHGAATATQAATAATPAPTPLVPQ